MAEHKKAEPDIIDEAKVVASTAPDGFLGIERTSKARRLFDCGVDEAWIAQIRGKLFAQRGKYLRVVGYSAVREHRLHDSGQRVAVATVVHLGYCSADAKEDPSPTFVANRITKIALDTDAKCREQT